MNKFTLISLFCLLFSISDLSGQKAASQHVILISIDGLRPDFYLQKRWPSPVIQKMAEEGAHAKAVKGVFPSVTYPSHTTIISGQPPAQHGIYYNAPFEPEGETGRWYWEYEQIKTPTLFSLVREAGKKSAAISWPVTVGAPIDYNIPEIWSLDPEEEKLAPLKRNATPKGFVEEIELNATGKINNKNFGNEGYFAREQNFASAASYIFETYQPELLALHLLSADHFQHTDGREGYMVDRAVAAVDAAIGQILETVERLGMMDQTTFIITGDHGFVDIHSVFAPNVLLKEAGLIGAEEENWAAKFHTSGAAAFLHLNTNNDENTLKKVREILQNMPSEYKKLFRIVERKELEEIGADPNAVLALAPVQGIAMTSSSKGELLKKGSGGTHGFFPEFDNIHTGFIAFGAGIKKGAVIPGMSLTDVAPVIMELLNLQKVNTAGLLYPGIIEKK